MKVEVSYFGHLRMKAGTKAEDYVLEAGATLGSLIGAVSRKRDLGDQLIGRSSVNILVNGRNMNFLDGMGTELSEGDEVSIFPPTGGG